MGSKIDLSQFKGYSPGKWIVQEGVASCNALIVSVAGGYRICRFVGNHKVAIRANAHLMAKAPAILAYARELEAEVERLKEVI